MKINIFFYLRLIAFIIVILTIFYIFYIYRRPVASTSRDNKPTDSNKKITAYIINMDKNKDRLDNVIKNYEKSDIRNIPYKRFPAVIGKNVDIHDWLTNEAIVELKQVENKKYRNSHYQLTRGGIGCFLSHYALAKQLLSDTQNDYYLNLEDDIYIKDDAFKKLQNALKEVNPDWDFILFGYNRLLHSKDPLGGMWEDEVRTHHDFWRRNEVPETKSQKIGPTKHSLVDTDDNISVDNENFYRVTGFWGTHGMLMNKKGAKVFVDEVDQNKIDGQIDAYMSRMAQQGKLVVYAYRYPIFHTYNDLISDIQAPIKPKKDTDPFDFRGYKV
jgi:GR25 family glycosyltransferase involved in LPS biosynthesis